MVHTITEVRAGNALVFEQIYYQFHERFYWYVLKRTGSATLAEDVVQESFMKLWDRRASLSLSFPIEVQLARIIRTTLIDHLRKAASQRKVLESYNNNLGSMSTDNDPLLKKELAEKIQTVVQSLPPECKKVFQLSREEGLSYSQIASLLSISPKTVENQVSKALRVIRKAVFIFILLYGK